MISYFDQFFLLITFHFCFFTNLFLIFLFSLFLYYFLLFSKNLLFSYWNILSNLFLAQFKGEIKTFIGNKWESQGYFSFIFTLFILILSLNLLGLFPYNFSPTVHIALTMGLSFLIILGSIIWAIYNFKDRFFSLFTPLGCPLILAPALVLIETISQISRIISLGVRLAANITAGHLLLAIISSFGFKFLFSNWFILSLVPAFILIFVIILEIAVAFIQAYVFCLLTSIYISESYHLH